jgi:hemerythrin-like domain-containing protein
MIKIGRKPALIESPIEHLTACHRRIEDRLETLERAGEWLASEEEAKKAEAREAIASALRFLDSSGAMHTADEESSLFPRLLPKLEAGEREYVEGLERQHREVDEAYAELKAAAANSEAERYGAAAARVARLYRDHIASEDQVLPAIARRCLSAGDLGAIAAEMRERRGAAQGGR